MKQLNAIEYYLCRLREECERKSCAEVGAFMLSRALRMSFTTNSSIWYRLPLLNYLPVIQPKISTDFDIMPVSQAKDFFRRNHSFFPWMYIDEELDVAAAKEHIFPSFSIDGRVISYLKVGVKEAYMLDFCRVLHLPPATAIIYDSFVLPEFRRKGLGASILSRTADHLRKKGFTTLWAQIPEWNAASVKMTVRAGFQPVGKVRYIRSFGKEVFLKQPKDFPLRLRVTGNQRELALDDGGAGESAHYRKRLNEQAKQTEINSPS